MTIMLYLLFSLDSDRYVIKATDIIEIVPLVKLTRIPKTPDYVSGMFNYRGKAVPVIDMRRLTNSQSYNNIMSTRIILVEYTSSIDESHVLGLIVEHVTDMIYLSEDIFEAPVVHVNENRFVSDVATDQTGLIQRIDVEKLLPEHIRDVLFIKNGVKEVSRVS